MLKHLENINEKLTKEMEKLSGKEKEDKQKEEIKELIPIDLKEYF